jgi:hypothetical protein
VHHGAAARLERRQPIDGRRLPEGLSGDDEDVAGNHRGQDVGLRVVGEDDAVLVGFDDLDPLSGPQPLRCDLREDGRGLVLQVNDGGGPANRPLRERL